MDPRAKLNKVSPQEYHSLKQFAMERPPHRQMIFLRPLSWLLSFPAVWKHRLKIDRSGLAGIKPPFILVCSHMSFMDFKVTTAALFPWRSNYVVAVDGFIGREGLLRLAGGILKRRVTNDLRLIGHIRTILHRNKDILSVYPEARYSLIGTTAILPESLGKLIKFAKVPVVVLKMHGNYLNSPVWNLTDRGVPLEAEMSLIFKAHECREMDVAAINQKLSQALNYDEYAWQAAKKIRINHPQRAKGLHHVIWLCPCCKTQSRMSSGGADLGCDACGKTWTMDEYGRMSGQDGITEFAHLPDWFEFQRHTVRKELESGTYRFEDDVRVEALVNAKGYFDCGTGRLIHSHEGLELRGNPEYLGETIRRKPQSMHTCHVEFDYFGKGDCIDISTNDRTWYVYPLTHRNVVTKILQAVEELHKLCSESTQLETFDTI